MKCKNSITRTSKLLELSYVSGVYIDDMVKRFLDKFKIDFS